MKRKERIEKWKNENLEKRKKTTEKGKRNGYNVEKNRRIEEMFLKSVNRKMKERVFKRSWASRMK